MAILNTLYPRFPAAIHERKMILQHAVMPCNGDLSFFGAVEVKTPYFFGLQDLLRGSLLNRIVAVHKWLKNISSEQ